MVCYICRLLQDHMLHTKTELYCTQYKFLFNPLMLMKDLFYFKRITNYSFNGHFN